MKRLVALFMLVAFLFVSVSPALAYQSRKQEPRQRPVQRNQVQRGQVQRNQIQNRKVNNPGLFLGGIVAGIMASWFLENSARAVNESFRSKSVVSYKDTSGARVEARPVSYYKGSSGLNSNLSNRGQRECAKILVSSYDENGNVIKSEEQEVCE